MPRGKYETTEEATMVLEIAEIDIKDGKIEETVETLCTRALKLTESYAGCLSFRALRGVENPNKILLLAEWSSIEAHLASRKEPAHAAFRELMYPFSAGARTEHFEPI
jgi:quinol monooxygenase YgiN